MELIPGPVPIYSFVDLDDTLFQPHHRRDPGPEGRCVVTGMTRIWDSWQCPAQQALTAMLFQTSTVIPCTARSTLSINRVNLGPDFTSWRIASGGAVILRPDGTEEEVWRARMVEQMNKAQSHLNRLLEAFEPTTAGLKHASPGQWHTDGDRRVAISFREPNVDEDPSLYARMQRWMERHLAPIDRETIEVHRRNQTLTVRPVGTSKGDAVRYLLATHLPFERLVLGFGDSPEDQGFLDLCDYAAHPNLNPYTKAQR